MENKKIWYKVCYYDELTRRVRFCEVISKEALPEIVDNVRQYHVGVFVTCCTEEVVSDFRDEIGATIDPTVDINRGYEI